MVESSLEDEDGEPIDDDAGVEEYTVVLKVTAAQRLEAVSSPRDRFVLRSRIAALVGDPRPSDAECLPSYPDRRRLRYRGYRILYSIDEARRTVTISGLGYRRPPNPARPSSPAALL